MKKNILPIQFQRLHGYDCMFPFLKNCKVYDDNINITRAIGISNDDILPCQLQNPSMISAYILTKAISIIACDDYDFYLCTQYLYGNNGLHINEIKKIDLKNLDSMFENENIAEILQSYRQFMIDNLDKIEPGLSEQYVKDLAEHCKSTGQDILYNRPSFFETSHSQK